MDRSLCFDKLSGSRVYGPSIYKVIIRQMRLDLNLPDNKQLLLLNFRPGESTRKIAAFGRNGQRRAAAKQKKVDFTQRMKLPG